jgi:hypothetical protein
MTVTLPKVDVGIEPLRTLHRVGGPSGPRPAVPFIPGEGEHYFESPLGYGSFFAGQSDYEVPSDELYCPCGVTLEWPDRNLATAVEAVDEHIAEAHPDATAKARAKRRREAKRCVSRLDRKRCKHAGGHVGVHEDGDGFWWS